MKYLGSISFFAGFAAMLAVGWAGFPRLLYRSAQQPFSFSHKVHAGEKAGMKCEDCHAFRADGTYSGVPTLDKCSGCHAAAMTTTAAEKTLIEKYVTPNREVPWLVYSRQPDNVYFSHAQHLKLGKLACERCHRGHGRTDTLRPYQEDRISGYSKDIWGSSISRISFKGRTDGMRMDDCVACHKQHHVADSCLACHK
ncbi:MAG: cytochrome c3 family protein [Acidobacteria bacterium]|nr:cytochrome c3 family protein [Acidobacteriota bacterium]